MSDEFEIDGRAIVRWLGVEGARAGLEASRALTNDALRRLAEKIGCPPLPKSATRAQIIDDLIRQANRRIDKPLDELLKMTEPEIVGYLERVNPAREEMLDLLSKMKTAPTREGQKGLIRIAAREIVETARYISIASSGTQLRVGERPELKDADVEKLRPNDPER